MVVFETWGLPIEGGSLEKGELEMVDGTSQTSKQGDEALGCEVGGKSVATDLQQFQLIQDKNVQILKLASSKGYDPNDLKQIQSDDVELFNPSNTSKGVQNSIQVLNLQCQA